MFYLVMIRYIIPEKMEVKSALSQVAHTAGAYPGFCSIK